MTCRISGDRRLALVLAGPRLSNVMEAKAGHYLKRIVLEAPPASSKTFDRPTMNGVGILRSGFETEAKRFVSVLAVAAAA